MLVLLPGAAGTRIVAPDFLPHPDRSLLRSVGHGYLAVVLWLGLALAELRRLAAGSGMKVIELDQLLEPYYRKHRRALDFKPVDSHWNGTATALVADEIVRVLGALPGHAVARAP